MGTIITLIIALFYGCISYYLFLPALTLRSIPNFFKSTPAEKDNS